jgi:hypothetical protein
LESAFKTLQGSSRLFKTLGNISINTLENQLCSSSYVFRRPSGRKFTWGQSPRSLGRIISSQNKEKSERFARGLRTEAEIIVSLFLAAAISHRLFAA